MARRKKNDDMLDGGDEHELFPLGGGDDDMPGFLPSEPDDQEELAASAPMTAGQASEAMQTGSGYVVLARRYRPQTFDQIVGQEHVEKTLRGAIEGGQIGHAYLFSGPRGTGKTSTARILAKALNCQNNGPRPDPCGRCDSCRAITAGSSLDVIEIDAASNTGVDNIRELRGGVVLAPFSRFKVYIVDEVHMLSTAAFNALLKTLEEPPAQVVFVLATTELQKVPETIVSRCQTFMFRRFSISEIAGQLGKILDQEMEARGLTIDPDDRVKMLDMLARNAEGGMRDAQVALDQVLVFSHGKIDFESVRRFLGVVQVGMLDDIFRAIYERKTEDLLLAVDNLASSGQDLELFVKSLTEQARDLLIIRNAPKRNELINVSDDRYEALRELSNSLPTAFLLNTSSAFLELSEQMKTSSQQRFLLEMLLIRLTQVDHVDDLTKILDRLQRLEKGGVVPAAGATQALSQSAPSVASAQPPRNARYEAVDPMPSPRGETTGSQISTGSAAANVKVEESASSENVGISSTVTDQSPAVAAAPISAATAISGRPELCTPEEFLQQLRDRTVQRSHYLHVSLLETRILSLSESTAVLEVGHKFEYDHLSRAQNQQALKEIAREVCGRDIVIKVQMGKGPDETERAAAMAAVPASSPVEPEATPVGQTRGESMQPPQQVSRSAEVVASSAESSSVPDDDAGAEESGYADVYYPPELLKSIKPLKPEAFRQFMERHADVKELVMKVKEVFKVDDSAIEFRSRAI